MAITVVNKHYHKPQPNDVYIGRGSEFGNIYTHIPSGTKAQIVVKTRDIACDMYEEYFDKEPMVQKAFEKLVRIAANNNWDINLVCYCAPKRCHGDYIKQKLLERKAKLTGS